MNNKAYKAIIFYLFLISIVTLTFCFIHSYYDKTHYSTIAIVDDINSNEVLMVDPCGDVWAVDHVDNIKVGDLVEVCFYNNNTDTTHHDDIITNVKTVD